MDISSLSILYLPEVALEKIFSFLSFDEIARNRIVCKKFNEIGGKLLSRGFIQLEKRHANCYKRVKSTLPRRESERKVHPLARHCDILQAIETRISMLSMTYNKYIENNLICFIPGKVLDEMKIVLDIVESNTNPPRTCQLLQELRDLSSMAMEHFDEQILPKVKEHMDRRSAINITSALASTSKYHPKILYGHNALTNEIFKVKKESKSHKHYISALSQGTQKLCQKVKKQHMILKSQAKKIKQQEQKLSEQNTKIQEQEAALADIRKHIDEWDQKLTDLTTELIRARDDIVAAATQKNTSSSPSTLPSPPKIFKSNIKPRAAHILPKNYISIYLDPYRKRKSNLLPEIPLKRNKAPENDLKKESQLGLNRNDNSVNVNIPDIVNFDRIRIEKNKPEDSSENMPSSRFSRSNIGSVINSSLEQLLKGPLTSIKSRKRKMTEDIDLK